MLNRGTPSGHRQRGLSLVELLVGITVGLFIVVGASLVVSTQLGENRRLLMETQLQQDLRASADIITRELRRAGFWGTAQQGIWRPGAPAVVANPFSAVSPASAPASETVFRYRRRPTEEGPFGFKLDDNGAIRSLIGDAWQELTDPAVMRVTAFTVTPQPEPAGFPVKIPCPHACSTDPTDTSCWPTLAVREYVVDITAQARNDITVQRNLRTRVRLRNDAVVFDPALAGQVCPP